MQHEPDDHLPPPDDIPGTLGAPIRREQQKPEDPGRWVPASEPHYLRHTKSGAVSHEQFVPASERPTKPSPGMCLESGEFVPAEQINAQPAQQAGGGEVPKSLSGLYELNLAFYRCVGRKVPFQAIQRTTAPFAVGGSFNALLVPADRRAEVIAALNKLGS